jgi:hypothetical protein
VTVPIGWKGPVVLTEIGAACSDPFGVDLAVGETNLVGEPAKCDCTCGSPTGQSCGQASLKVSVDDKCADPKAFPAGTTCLGSISAASQLTHAQAIAPNPMGGSCPAQPNFTVPPAKFDVQHVCGPSAPGPDCDPSGACTPFPGTGLVPRLCVRADGDVPCPGGEFNHRVQVYRDNHADDRRCDGQCTCGAPTGTCDTSITVFDTAALCDSSPLATITPAMNCALLPFTGLSSIIAVIKLMPDACKPSQLMPLGKVAGLNPMTVCCTNTLN